MLDNMKKSNTNIKAQVVLTKYYELLECALALVSTGPMDMEQHDLDLALNKLAENNHQLPWDLKVDVTKKAALEAARGIETWTEDDNKGENAVSLEAKIEQFWEIFNLQKVYADTFEMIDAWSHREPRFAALVAILQDHEAEDKGAEDGEEDKKAADAENDEDDEDAEQDATQAEALRHLGSRVSAKLSVTSLCGMSCQSQYVVSLCHIISASQPASELAMMIG